MAYQPDHYLIVAPEPPSHTGNTGLTGCPHCESLRDQNMNNVKQPTQSRKRTFVNNRNTNKINYKRNKDYRRAQSLNSGR